ncbi:MAG: hypothetical protein K2P80_01565 [Beijerinckiaceae bacterium]|nr:hypothetical protein [Beijerinckiaceae bacterium]
MSDMQYGRTAATALAVDNAVVSSKPISSVDWAAIFAGGVVAAAISTLMTTFGAAIGLSATSPFSGQGLSARAIGIATAIWVLWVAVSSFMVGGYLSGRLRRRSHDASEHESDVRDGSHGLVVWALGTLLIAYLATSSVAGITRAGVDALSKGASAVGGVSMKALDQAADPIGSAIDRLTRGNAQPGVNADQQRTAITRTLANAVTTGALSPEDKSFLSSQVAAAAGISPEEANKRIDDTMAQVNALSDKAKHVAESARKTGVLVAFLTAASLVISAAAAWWAATIGGKHRDENTDLSHFWG